MTNSVAVSETLGRPRAEQIVRRCLCVGEARPRSTADAQRLGVTGGDTVEVAQNGTAVKATVSVHTGVPAGTVFLADGLAEDSANAFTSFEVEVRKP